MGGGADADERPADSGPSQPEPQHSRLAARDVRQRRVFWASNPKARHTRAQVALLQPKLDAFSAQALRVTRADEWRQVLASARFVPEDLLVVHGGDGTLQVIVSALGDVLPVAEWPTLAILPAGGTNMTAYDGGGRQTFAQALQGLEDVLAGRRAWGARERFVISARDEQHVRFGFFFGAGVIVQGIEFYHQEIARGAVGDEFASGLTLLRGAWGIARREARFTATSHAQFTANGVSVDDDLLMLFATTLDRMFMGITPWWGDGRGGMHTTWIHANAKRFFWRFRGKKSACADSSKNAAGRCWRSARRCSWKSFPTAAPRSTAPTRSAASSTSSRAAILRACKSMRATASAKISA